MIVVAGEALVDLVQNDAGDRARYRAIPGGSPANVAVGLARLGQPVQFLGRLADDGFGRQLRAHLRHNGVGLDLVVAATEPASLAVVSLDDSGQATYGFYVTGTADWQWRPDELPERLPAEATALVTGSLAVALEPGSSALAGLLRRERARGVVTVVLDPNIRPALLGERERARPHIEGLVKLVDVVKLSREDLDWLCPEEDPRRVAAAWAALGPRLVVVTGGERGAYAVTAHGEQAERPAANVPLVDTVGAGDAFTAGLVAGMAREGLLGAAARTSLGKLDGTSLAALLDEAVLVAALTCGRAGADPPTVAELADANS